MLLPLTSDDGVLLDLRYATAANMTGRPIYRRPVAMLHPEAHARLRAAASRAAVLGLGFRIFDAFRPLDAQWALWAALPDPRFVADPRDASGFHPRGAAVDLTLVDQAAGTDLDMGTGFDEMTPHSAHAALDLPPAAVRNPGPAARHHGRRGLAAHRVGVVALPVAGRAGAAAALGKGRPRTARCSGGRRRAEPSAVARPQGSTRAADGGCRHGGCKA